MSRLLALNSRVRTSTDVLSRHLGPDLVLLDVRSGVYFSLDPVGARIWNLLAEPCRVGEVLASLLAEYDVTEAQCTADLVRLVTEMRDRGLVEVDPPGPA